VAVACTDFISQRSIAGGPVFQFNDGYLEYTGFEWQFKTRYEDIAGPSQYRRTQTKDLVPVGTFFYLIFLAWVLLYREHFPHYAMEGLHWFVRPAIILVAVLAAVCGPLYYLTHKRFTVIPTRSGNVFVVRDKQHDVIVKKIQAARLNRLRQLSAPDPANSPEEELAKLELLRDEGAITNDEYARLASQIVT
jgi:hypothetical protein